MKEEVENSIPSRFAKIARRYPDRPAVKTANRILTYAELDTLSNRVAWALLAQRKNEPECVGLLLQKDAPLMASMLGVLKAGKFFVLLDPSFPKARIATMLEDSEARWVIAGRRHASMAKEAARGGSRLLDFESIHSTISAEDLKPDI
ncbi:MAG: AMP-binding protein, partial [Candidatus Binatia bacterium]